MKLVKIFSFSSAAALLFSASNALGAVSDVPVTLVLRTLTNPCTGTNLVPSGNIHITQTVSAPNSTIAAAFNDVAGTDPNTRAVYRTTSSFTRTGPIGTTAIYQQVLAFTAAGQKSFNLPLTVTVLYTPTGASILNGKLSPGTCIQQPAATATPVPTATKASAATATPTPTKR
jgi:hypothetical protein